MPHPFAHFAKGAWHRRQALPLAADRLGVQQPSHSRRKSLWVVASVYPEVPIESAPKDHDIKKVARSAIPFAVPFPRSFRVSAPHHGVTRVLPRDPRTRSPRAQKGGLIAVLFVPRRSYNAGRFLPIRSARGYSMKIRRSISLGLMLVLAAVAWGG